MTNSRSAAHFERLYQSNPDPWAFQTSPYEQAKYRQTIASLGDRRFRSGLEVGCSIGILTHMLADRCDALLGIDIVEAPLQAARARCAGQPHVRLDRMQVPADWPPGPFDLIVFSEVLYFLSAADIQHCAAHVRRTLLHGGLVVIVNWLGETDDPTPGQQAGACFISAAADFLNPTDSRHESQYRLDVLSRA